MRVIPLNSKATHSTLSSTAKPPRPHAPKEHKQDCVDDGAFLDLDTTNQESRTHSKHEERDCHVPAVCVQQGEGFSQSIHAC